MSRPQLNQPVVKLASAALKARSFPELVQGVLPQLVGMTEAAAAFLYLVEPTQTESAFFQHGVEPETAGEIEGRSAELFKEISSRGGEQPSIYEDNDAVYYPLWSGEDCLGLIGLIGQEEPLPEEVPGLLAEVVARLSEHLKLERRLSHLNAYLTVSSNLAQSLELHKLLEIALYSAMEAASAEEASILLLDDEKKNFRFFHVEGPAKPVLEGTTFPVDKGLAGSVLRTEKAEIVNDVYNDPRFYREVDRKSGFKTRNLIAVPLVAGEEKIGILEVLNKAGEGSFTEDERLLLLSISEEIAFAIRNAKMFEYVADIYCKQRRGQATCKGCERPLGSWTPCVKYREIGV